MKNTMCPRRNSLITENTPGEIVLIGGFWFCITEPEQRCMSPEKYITRLESSGDKREI